MVMIHVFDLAERWLRRGVVGAATLMLAVGLGACSSDTPDASSESASLRRSVVPDSMTIPRMLETDDRFSTLRTALDSTKLDSLLATDGPYTLFAPPNEAFDALPPGTVETLLTERHDRLRTILAHHLVDGRLSTEDRSEPRTVTTMSGDTLSLRSTDTGVFVGDVSVVDGDVEAANGLIHVVDRVLPPSEARTP